MKVFISPFRCCLIIVASFLFVGCRSSSDNEELAAAAQRELVASSVRNPSVTVKDGVATLTGECADESCRTDAVARLDSIEGITRIVNNIVVKP